MIFSTSPLPVSRRTFLKCAALMSAAPCFPAWCLGNSFETATEPVAIQTSEGILQGEQNDRVRIFRGVPYAEPPVGKLRFRPPVPLASRSGVRPARSFAAAAMQSLDTDDLQSEDCLYLNVWAPRSKGPHPVFVWVHGGGFVSGRSSFPIQDGTGFAQEGVVVVTVGYRLGVFGFLDVSPMLDESYRSSANNSLRDLIQALQWVQENIGAFGGDPHRVTVGGQSAGAKLTDLLLSCAEAQPLFTQAISESGGADRAFTPELSLEVSRSFKDCWKRETGQDARNILAAPAEQLIAVQKKFLMSAPVPFPLRCQVDGELLPRIPLQEIERKSHGKRLLIGTNRDECASFIGANPVHNPAAANLGNVPLATFQEVFAHYPMIYPQMTPPERRIRALTAEEYWVPSLRVAEAFVRGGGSAWMYRLDDPFKTGPLKGQAAHTHDVHFVWNSPQKSGEGSEQDQILAQQVHSAWVAFLAGGSPAAPGLPAWEPYGLVARSTMILNSASQMEKLPWDEERRLWEGKLLGPAGWKLDERPDPPAGHASDSSHQNSLLKIPLP